MNLLKCILTANDCYKAGRKITPKGVMVHSTGANNTTVKRYVQPLKTDPNYSALMSKLGKNSYNNDWNRSGVEKCVHAFIGKLADGTIATVQTLPWNHRAWHCYKGKNGSGNDTYISFEICEDNLTNAAYFKAAYQEAVELTAMLCKEYNLDPMKDGVVICHSEGAKRGIASNHGDVMHWFPKHGKTMDDFRKAVQAQMGKGGVTAPTTSQKPTGGVSVANKGNITVKMPVLQKGSEGNTVKALQALLIGYGYSCGSSGVDGDFGAATDKAVRSYQKANKLAVDGSVGTNTWNKLLGIK